MSETQQEPFALGDSVISTRCLVTKSIPGQVRVEIPSASLGTVVEADPRVTWAPYRVVFEAGHGGLVEMRVTADAIGRISPREPLVPILRDEPEPLSYEPSAHRPHRWCKVLHGTIILEGCIAYGLVLLMQPRLLLLITALIVGVAYAHQMTVCRRFAWIPEIFLPLTPEENEELVVYPQFARRAAGLDLFVVVLLGTLLVHHLLVHAHADRADVTLFLAHLFVTAMACLIKMVMHDKAAHIYPKHN